MTKLPVSIVGRHRINNLCIIQEQQEVLVLLQRRSKRFFSSSSSTETSSKVATTDGATTGDAAPRDVVDELLKAPFQKTARMDPSSLTLFPWRHEDTPLDRWIPGTRDFHEKGHLVGSNLHLEYPGPYSYFTAYCFLNVPLYQCLMFSAWKADLADSFSWAFTQGVAGILSNVYQVSFDDISNDSSSLHFNIKNKADSAEPSSSGSSNGSIEDQETNSSPSLSNDACDSMMDRKLQDLYQSAHEHGKDRLQIRLETQPIPSSSKIMSLVSFPFLTRDRVESDKSFSRRYREMVYFMEKGSFKHNSPELLEELVAEFRDKELMETTVICQALIPCNEVFCVRDLSAGGKVVQGHDDELVRTVWHQVRMEMVVQTVPKEVPGRFIQVENKIGNWQITDIDDLLGGNLIV